MPRRSTLKDREPLPLNSRHALVEFLLCDHPFEEVSDKLLALQTLFAADWWDPLARRPTASHFAPPQELPL